MAGSKIETTEGTPSSDIAGSDARPQVSLQIPADEFVRHAYARGPQGRSAYDIARDNGFVGTIQQWLASLGQAYYEFVFEDTVGNLPGFVSMPILKFKLVRGVTFAPNFEDCQIYLTAPAVADHAPVTFSFRCNGTQLGTIVFTSASVPFETITVVRNFGLDPIVLKAGDLIEIVPQSIPGVADYAFSMRFGGILNNQ